MTIVNCDNKDKEKAREESRQAMQDAVSHKKTLKLPKEITSTRQEDIFPLLDAFTRKHELISSYFCSGAGIDLQYKDSVIAEQVMVHFCKMGYPILPMHDSFIIHHGWEQELKDTMNKAFRDMFGVNIQIKPKWKSIKERQKRNTYRYQGPPETHVCDDTLEELLEDVREDGPFRIYNTLLNQFRKYKKPF